jgi:hypothetical protein
MKDRATPGQSTFFRAFGLARPLWLRLDAIRGTHWDGDIFKEIGVGADVLAAQPTRRQPRPPHRALLATTPTNPYKSVNQDSLSQLDPVLAP